MIAIIDYDAGNIMSVNKALIHLGEETSLTRDKDVLMAADKVILPGVGSFGDAMEKLKSYDLVDVIKEIAKSGKPFLGICLGLQLLFESSDESPGVDGLGILKGSIKHIPPKEGLKIPHMGWNSLEIKDDQPLFKGVDNGSYVYFVHSYYLDAADKNDVAATTNYSVEIDASVRRDNIFACQFHPEKSGEVGLKILKNFIDIGR
ncbi:MAG: imidazole glycerol phosphate synthase subunit HisH [Lachnospiraceae bacterium]|nr:imidazole glycerol phosphate synthase subunit HisH [Lachnospiraceae bacterium]